MEIQITTIPPSDAILELFEQQHPITLRWGLKVKKATIKHPRAKFFYLLEDGIYVGEIILGFLDKTGMNVDGLTVLREYQGRGYGRQLLKHAMTYTKSEGFEAMTAVARDGASCKLFVSEGFEIRAKISDWAGLNEPPYYSVGLIF